MLDTGYCATERERNERHAGTELVECKDQKMKQWRALIVKHYTAS